MMHHEIVARRDGNQYLACAVKTLVLCLRLGSLADIVKTRDKQFHSLQNDLTNYPAVGYQTII